jgi:hypothetical protein
MPKLFQLTTTMNAMIIYDDAVYAGKAKSMFESAAHRAGEALLWAVKPWRLDLLNLPAVAEMALKDAADAHLILFGLRNPRTIPPWLQTWLEQWAALRQVSEAALAVLGGANGELLSATAVPALSQFADHYGLSLIFGEPESEETRAMAPAGDLHQVERRVLPQIYHMPSAIYFYGCGINE